MASEHSLLLAFYGDDFTGSTDAMEFLTRAGARTILFIAPPTAEQLARFPDLQAIGVAGMTRAMPPTAIEAELRPAFAALRDLGPLHVHYKVCSTFDSSPAIGSIGRAIDVGAEIFPGEFVPLVVGAPILGRYCVFGNLFARMGLGTDGEIHRLDRHPSMSRHPVTPADEADLWRHLTKQTQKRIDLFDILHVEMPLDQARAALEKLLAGPAAIVLFDVLVDEHLRQIGALIDPYASRERPLYSVGSSAVEMALGAHWANEGRLKRRTTWPEPGPADPLLVLSGSCSPVSSKQIEWALSHGFADVALDTPALAAEGEASTAAYKFIAESIAHLKAGRSVIVHTSRGADDPRIKATTEAFARTRSSNQTSAQLFGSILGRIARQIVEQLRLKRLVIAGGDTSSFAARALGIESLEMIAPISPGAPLCRATAPAAPADGLEFIFKGGQVGAEDFYGIAARGRP